MNDVMNYEISAQIEVANKFKRDNESVLSEALAMATRTQETAEGCFYTLERGKTPICGPSIRLAEICTSAWGNLRIGAGIKSNDGTFITAEGWCWDMQKNLFVSKECKRSIKYANGGTYNNDMQGVTGNAACSIAQRNAIFAVIPRAFVNSVFEECKKVAVGDNFSLKRSSVFERLEKAGVSQRVVLDFFSRDSLEQFDREDLVGLIGIGNAVKDGLCSLQEAFHLTPEKKVMDVDGRIAEVMKNKKSLEVENETI